MFMGRALTVLSDQGRTAHAIILGIDSLTSPGLYEMTLSASDDAGGVFQYKRRVALADGGYPQESIQIAPELADLLNPAITQPEARRITQIVSNFTSERYFNGLFGLPCPAPVTSQYGSRRSYNGGPFENVHTGADFAAMPGAAIYAPAGGVVVLAEALSVRGNATIIDHGWGIYTGYWHQEAISVRVGQKVAPGEVIGTVGRTGRVTGPHLHWELFVGGVPVDPLQWVRQSFP
jgi:murein DD-endopeptidase MepM/ murein hydrolase activator NlpD